MKGGVVTGFGPAHRGRGQGAGSGRPAAGSGARRDKSDRGEPDQREPDRAGSAWSGWRAGACVAEGCARWLHAGVAGALHPRRGAGPVLESLA